MQHGCGDFAQLQTLRLGAGGLLGLPADARLGLRLVVQILLKQRGRFRVIHVERVVVIPGVGGCRLIAQGSAYTE
ncbi:MAG: hypothetical protein A2W37_17020 [Chloroflexi bacterium RBG_16_63_12]|nr:MAG: hypothetical protein A2W37_17020 [Chloroflexi bacterium RBG_16_63_12]